MTELPPFAGKVAVVTGGSRGIGRAIVLAMASEGANVAFSYRKETRAARDLVVEVERLGRRAIAVPSDASHPDETEDFVQQARRELGRIDVVVPNAGIPGPVGWEAVSAAAWREVLETNLVGPYSLVRATRPHFPSTGGSVVFIASIAGLRAPRDLLAYAAAKSGVLSLTRTLAVALAPKVRVNAVVPGWVRTPMTRDRHEPDGPREKIRRSIPRGRWGEPDDIAAAVLFLASEMAGFVTGEALVVDGGSSLRWGAAIAE
jgi:NAD(P)-dependent dehydrogenase (short-subunit alcohol dehydrogenase family)